MNNVDDELNTAASELINAAASPPDLIRRMGRFYFAHWMEHPEYFQIFWAIENQSVIGELPQGVIDEANTRHLADDLASNAGVYTFTFGDGSQVTALFSYLYQRVGGDWKILEHHSSAMPEG